MTGMNVNPQFNANALPPDVLRKLQPIPGLAPIGGGTLPLPVKQVYSPLPEEMALMKKIDPNWTKGDPIAGDISGILRQMQQEIDYEIANMSPVAPTHALPPSALEVTPLDKLSPDRQQYYLNMMRDVQAAATRARDQQQAYDSLGLSGAHPSVQQAAQELFSKQAADNEARTATAIASAAHAQLQPISFDAQPAQPTATQPAQPAAPQPVAWVSVTPAPAAPQPVAFSVLPTPAPQPPAPAPAPQPSAVDTPATTEPHHCERCFWPVGTPIECNPTKEDKRVFLAAMLGTNKRFWKEYALFGGNMRVTFRSLTNRESDAILEQLQQDIDRKSILPGCDAIRLREYRLAASLDSISLPTGLKSVPAMANVAATPGDVTGLPRLRDAVFNELINSELLRRAVNREFAMFQRLVEMLDANANNQDFYLGIDTST